MWRMREATAEDVPQINEIKNWYVRETTVTWSWKESTVAETMAWFLGHKPPYHPVYVIEEDSQVLAFGSLSVFRPREGYWPVVENSIYARHDSRRRGFGKVLMTRLIEDAKVAGLWAITAWITDENLDSIRFHEKLGFYHSGSMPGVGEKFGRRLGLTIMQLDVTPMGQEGTHEQGVC